LKLPRDLSGHALASLLKPFGYRITRQTGSHVRLSSSFRGGEHRLTIPAHSSLKVGTLNSILSDVATYLKIDKSELQHRIFS
jgi:predicted RNA binding protein YcfA (HicA-like mRNA interferase family)